MVEETLHMHVENCTEPQSYEHNLHTPITSLCSSERKKKCHPWWREDNMELTVNSRKNK